MKLHTEVQWVMQEKVMRVHTRFLSTGRTSPVVILDYTSVTYFYLVLNIENLIY